MDGEEKVRVEEGGRKKNEGEEKQRGWKKGERRQSHFAEPAGLQCTVKLNKKGGEKRRKEGMKEESDKLH